MGTVGMKHAGLVVLMVVLNPFLRYRWGIIGLGAP